MNKTQTLFATFSARYGKPQLKDGQSIQAIAQSYEAALGSYSLSDLDAACSDWMATSKWARWPEPAELLEILRAFGAKPETVKRIDMKPETRQAQIDASRWYTATITRPLPEGAWPCTWADALAEIIGVGRPEHMGRNFGWLLTHAWLTGAIPRNFEAKAAEYFARMGQKKRDYIAAVRQHGALAVHERRT